MTMKKTIILMLACMCVFMNASAQRNSGRLSLGVGLLYENGMDVTLAYEHEMNYRHAWEFFANGYLKWILRSYLSGILLAQLSHLRFRCGVQTLCGAWTQPLRQLAYRSFGRERHEQVSCRNPCGLRAQLCAAVGMHTVLAGKEGHDDKRGGFAADRYRAGGETADKIKEKQKTKIT